MDSSMVRSKPTQPLDHRPHRGPLLDHGSWSTNLPRIRRASWLPWQPINQLIIHRPIGHLGIFVVSSSLKLCAWMSTLDVLFFLAGEVRSGGMSSPIGWESDINQKRWEEYGPSYPLGNDIPPIQEETHLPTDLVRGHAGSQEGIPITRLYHLMSELLECILCLSEKNKQKNSYFPLYWLFNIIPT